ncbi:MAG: hypothetical protein QW279_16500, partial [Candidatus Jordarchaeaceae archaeon]
MRFNKNQIKTLLKIGMQIFILCNIASALTFEDSAGNKIEIQKADRIICLNSDCLEAIIMLGAKEKIVGLGSYALQ